MPSEETASPISKALRFLQSTQVTTDSREKTIMDYAGNWPQCFAFTREGPYIRDVSPFAPAFIHHALSSVVETNKDALGVSDSEIDAAREMRKSAIRFLLRFEAEDGSPDAHTFGFWPADQDGWMFGDRMLASLFATHWQGPRFYGYRTPINVSFFPDEFAIPTDADVTAVVYSALLDDARLDDGKASLMSSAQVFSDWRDLGQVPQRNRQTWIPDQSGAFLTWLAYRDDPSTPRTNDVDALVNASVLFALGRYDMLQADGVSDAIGVINAAVAARNDMPDPNKMSLYYPDNFTLHYYVARAYDEGNVQELKPSVDLLVAELVENVELGPDQQYYWDRGDPHMNTAFAALTLMAADREPELVRGAIDYLIAEQDPVDGNWAAGVFFLGRLDDGTEPVWLSSAFTTGMALEAICRYKLELQ